MHYCYYYYYYYFYLMVADYQFPICVILTLKSYVCELHHSEKRSELVQITLKDDTKHRAKSGPLDDT
jgi:hypothetical protein